MVMNLKRKRVYVAARSVKRKIIRRRGFRGGRRRGGLNKFGRSGRTNAWTSETSNAQSLGYRTRRMSGSRYRRLLYNNTQLSDHYRSSGATGTDITTQAGSTAQTMNNGQAFSLDSGRFWSVAGGTQPIDTSIAVPNFAGSILLRGGRLGFSMYNTSDTHPFKVTAYLIRDAQRPSVIGVPATPSVGYNFDEMPEFHNDVGNIWMRRELIVKPRGVAQVEFRLKPMKVDQDNWLSPGTSQLTWYVMTNDFDNTATNTIRWVRYHNVSFSTDVIGA